MSDSKEQPVTIIYPNKQVASQVVELLTRKKPVGWSRKSYATYYRLEYAKQIIPTLDAMIVDRHNKIFRHEDMPRLSLLSLYLWVNQSFKFVRDYLDGPDMGKGKYDKLWREVKVSRDKGVGVSINFENFAATIFKSSDYVKRDEKSKWKLEIEVYLSNPNIKKPLVLDNLLLLAEDIEQMEAELEDIEGIQYSITSKSIKIIKTV